MASVFVSQPLGCSVGLQDSSTNTNPLQSPHNDSIRIIFISTVGYIVWSALKMQAGYARKAMLM